MSNNHTLCIFAPFSLRVYNRKGVNLQWKEFKKFIHKPNGNDETMYNTARKVHLKRDLEGVTGYDDIMQLLQDIKTEKIQR